MAKNRPKTGPIRAIDLRRGDVVRTNYSPGYAVLLEDPRIVEEYRGGRKYLEAQTRDVSATGRLCHGAGFYGWSPTQRVRICGWDFAEQVENRLKGEAEYLNRLTGSPA
jgi:hypothetical protein